MLNLVIFGPPGCGKGTQSARLVKKYNLIHLSTGDLLRNEISEGTGLDTGGIAGAHASFEEIEEWNIRADESRIVSKQGHWQVTTKTRKRRRQGRSNVLHSNK